MQLRRSDTSRLATIELCVLCALAWLATPVPAQDDGFLLPDIIVRRADLFDNEIATDVLPGRTHLRLTNGTANVGAGKLFLYGVEPSNGDGTQDVRQRIFRSDGSFEDRDAGEFVFHPEHGHIHVESWALYRLREVLPGDGVGDIIAESAKTSFCILDLQVYDRSLPGFARVAEFRTCAATIQGLSVGWLDVYDLSLPGQHIDITGLPDGHYWLESVVDPEDHVLESNEDNNVERIRVTLGDPNTIPDAYEPNDSPADLDGRPPGGPNSPNLGPTNPKRVVEGLSILVGDEDRFRFYSNETGTAGDFVRVDFENELGDLDLELLDATGASVGTADGTGDSEIISLAGLPEGWYDARVSGKDGATNLEYRLTVNPPANGAPIVEVIEPSAGELKLIHGADSYTVRWSASDPESDELWVSVFLSAEPVVGVEMLPVTTARFVEADLGAGVINSAEFEPGTYHVWVQITDGGTTNGAWADGILTFIGFSENCYGTDPDCNGNGILDPCELWQELESDCDSNGELDRCQISADPTIDENDDGVIDRCVERFHRGDVNVDGSLDVADAVNLLNHLFTGGPAPRCLEAADADNDGEVIITDPLVLLNFLFRGGGPPAPPGPPGSPCGNDPDEHGSPADLGCATYGRCE